jgi:NAD(P)-dependent dehydrogenase (short-subunit alcohol dehydrogenase family)
MPIKFDFAGKTALVTGAGRGLGLAIARAFVEAGGRVAVNDLTAEATTGAIKTLGGPPQAVAAPADLATADGPASAVTQALDRLGRLDFVVNNAAVNIEKPIEATDEAHWDLHLDVVLRAPVLVAAAALPALQESRGAIVNIASELGLHAIPNNVAYVTAKHGLIAASRAMAIELAADGIRVNTICPGTMDTELMRDCAAASGDPAAYYRAFNAYHPIGRIARPEEIAGFVLALLSPVASFMTGATIAVDGGSTAGRVW